MWLRRKRKREEPPQRRYADYIPGTETPPPPPPGRASIRITVAVDVEAWAQAQGKTVEEADRELGRRINDATSPMLAKLVTELGDMGGSILSATMSTGG
ncbi:hypothetical protein EV384_6341 [Micromonospora kangleipakensis]|uniref:Uncharacterized protein n=1 Tax=Micromonospora kangleipakensis TaxID=1077942 RepID=A0A4Q8BHS2_9ACTN|nr:hypothetical protein EV384_6341 [Micromonospora kangleipakensis]